ncbi:MAG: hypothetical protein V3T86_08230 [Planctomycetota bacterium]
MGHTLVRLWGSPREMGHAQGELLRGEILSLARAVLPTESGMEDFLIRGCGERIWPEVPESEREEMEGIAAATGLDRFQVLFLHTRFELQRFGLLKDSAKFRGRAAVGAGKRVVQHYDEASLGVPTSQLVLVLREGGRGSLLVALPGMVGGFCGARPGCVAALEPMEVEIDPSLKAPPWTIFLRSVLEAPPSVGRALDLAPSVYASVPINAKGLGIGTLVVGPPGAGFLASEQFAVAADVSDVPSGSVVASLTASMERRRERLTAGMSLFSDPAPPGVLSIGLSASPKAVVVTFRAGEGTKTGKVSFKGR